MSRLDEMLGQEGMDYFADTSAHTPGGGRGSWVAIQAHGDVAVIDVLEVSGSNVTQLTDFTLQVGEQLVGEFTEITLTSGAVRCLRNTQ